MSLDAFLRHLPGRCGSCGFHPPTQGCACPGQALKFEVLAAVNDAAPKSDKAAIDEAILRLARLGVPFSANDCRKQFPNVNGSVIGGRFNALGRTGQIRQTGNRVPSTLANTHGHPIHEWIGAAA